MRYLHTMVRVSNLEASLDFYCKKLGLIEVATDRQREGALHARLSRGAGRRRAGDSPQVELTYNWDPEALDRRA